MSDILEILEHTQYNTEKGFDIVLEALSFNSFNDDYFTEAGNNEGFFKKIIKAIKQIIDKFKKSINNIFTNNTIEKKITQVEEAIKEDPSVAKLEVKQPDYEKLEKLNEQAYYDISKVKSVVELEEKMNKYRKQRNMLVKGTAVVTTSLGAIILSLRHHYKKRLKTVDEYGARASSLVEEAKKKLDDTLAEKKELERENEKLKAGSSKVKQATVAVKTAVEETSDKVELAKVKSSATVELLKDSTSDIIGGITSAVDSLAKHTEGGFLAGLKKTGSAIKGAFDGTTRINNLREKVKKLEETKAKYETALGKWKTKYTKVKTPAERKECNHYINLLDKEIEDIKKEIDTTEKYIIDKEASNITKKLPKVEDTKK